MLPKNTKIKMGIFTRGSSVRVIGECDLIEQDNGNKDEAIYLYETTVIRDPRNEITQDEIDTWAKLVTSNFSQLQFSFKAVDREQADKFIAFNTCKIWKTVREISNI